MQQASPRPYPVIFDSADKRLRFGITDVGEFLDSVYREQASSKFFSTIIGRQRIEPHAKPEFTTADVVCEGYLYKKGSWMKNWKKRYFILRKDIRALCYYASREDLILLGSIPLDIDTRICNVQTEEADGHPHVLLLETDHDDTSSTNKTFIRFETFSKMKAWMLDILNEAQTFSFPDEEQIDWWASLFGNISVIEPKTHTARRDGMMPSKDDVEPLVVPRKTSASSIDRSPLLSAKISSIDAAVLEKHAEDSDEDTDNEDGSKTPSGKNAEPEVQKRASASAQLGSKISKHVKALKPEKPYGPPPFDKTTVEKYETPQGALAGLQISLRLCNICGFQDRLFVVIFGSLQPLAVPGDPAATSQTTSTSKTTPASNSKWEQLCRTELRTVKQRLSYSEASLNDVKIHFNLVESMIPDTYKSIRIVVYRQENDNSSKDPKAADLHMQSEIARTALPRKIFDLRSVLKIKMKVKSQPPMDITVPLVKDPEAVLGIVKVTSYDLNVQRQWFNQVLKISPYSERIYSFGANSGMTMTLEQLYASKYSTNTAQALLSLWSAEREDYLQSTIRLLKEHFSHSIKEEETRLRVGLPAGESLEERIAQQFEPLRQSIEVIEEMHQQAILLASLSLETCESANQGKDLVNNVIDPQVGGGVLRRSAWKKITAWQYCATNLNVHMLTSKFFQYADVPSMVEAETTQRNVHYVPTITLGCPAAHDLKFTDGGLRRIFADIASTENKLMWMQAIQFPTLEILRSMFENFPKEALSLFGTKCSFSQGEELAALLKKKYELSRRIDICSSQALGCALTSIRTVIMLAATGNGVFVDALCRGLKIGFVVMFQSMLSTQGAELGMIEDLDMAALWLSLVSVRIVSRGALDSKRSNAQTAAALDPNVLAAKLKELELDPRVIDGKPTFVGSAEDVIARRDSTGRVVVDIEVTAREAQAVMDAMGFMGQFDQRSINPLPDSCGFRFRGSPNVRYAEGDLPPRVHAVAEVVGLVFSQGVNEMQTLANLSSSRDVLKQVEINNATLLRTQSYYRLYRETLEFQLHQHTPDMIDALAAVPSSGPPLSSPPSGRATSPGGLVRMSLSPNPQSVAPVATGLATSMKRRKSLLRPSIAQSQPCQLQVDALTAAVVILKTKVLQYNDRLLDQLTESVATAQQTPHEKHVDILLRSSALVRQMAANVSILCKSGKDRTSMGVTLEQTRSLVEDLGVLNAPDVCQLMRGQGVRRMNVYANTGQSMFAFNQIQRRALPMCYRPPPGCHAGNVTS